MATTLFLIRTSKWASKIQTLGFSGPLFSELKKLIFKYMWVQRSDNNFISAKHFLRKVLFLSFYKCVFILGSSMSQLGLLILLSTNKEINN